jgi:hypothetical protein
MNIQNNIAKQQSSDYYKELKDIYKELGKLYSQLSKDETFSDILDIIKNDFLKSNISLFEESLTKPNYKDTNPKIIKVVKVVIDILENYTLFANNSDGKKLKDDIYNKIVDHINTQNEEVKKANDASTGAKVIQEYFRMTPEELSSFIDALTTLPNIDTIKTNNQEDYKIIKHICILKYYLNIFENNDDYGRILDDVLKKNITNVATYEKDLAEKKAIKNADNTEVSVKLTQAKNELSANTAKDVKKYKELFNYINLQSYDIVDSVSIRLEKIKKDAKDGKEGKDGKPVKQKANEANEETTFIEGFKKDIYYTVTNINNKPGTDINSQLKENSDEKVDLDARKVILQKVKVLLDAQLKALKDTITQMIDSHKDEYSNEIKEIRKVFKDYDKEKEYKDNISTILVNEETEIAKLLTKNADQKKQLEDSKKQQQRSNGGGRGSRGSRGSRGGRGSRGRQQGGEKKTNKYYEDKYADLKTLIDKIKALIDKIKDIEGKDDGDDPFDKKSGVFGDASDSFNSIYKNIWNDYVKETKRFKSKGVTFDTLKQDSRLYERVKENQLDPNDVLKISFQDKVIFICIILIIRTFTMVFLEFLIEYNFVSTIQRGVIIYCIIYILLVICGVLLINYDSYKLRIIVNYLNLHINSSNIFFHILLFILFIGLILIIINDNDNGLKSIDNVLNYTYIYTYIYEIAEKSKPGSDLLLSQKEKMKLQYRLDIITMIVFIFSSLLILIM